MAHGDIQPPIPLINTEAELALLAAIMHDNYSYEKIADILSPAHFAHPLHGYIFAAMETHIKRGQIADYITLKDYFKNNPGHLDSDYDAYLLNIAGSLVSPFVESYARTIRELYMRRAMIAIGQEIQAKAYQQNPEETANDLIEYGEKRLFELATEGEVDKEDAPLHVAIQEAIDSVLEAHRKGSGIIGVTTGFKKLDQRLGGFRPGNLNILAGRPSMGKTALATNIAYNAALAGTQVAFFSLEMSREQLGMRVAAQEANIAVDRLSRGAAHPEEFALLNDLRHKSLNTPLTICDIGALTVSNIRARARRVARATGLGLIVIDYLQLLMPPEGKIENPVWAFTNISRSLKALAKELNVPVLALSQLSRGVENREDKRPLLADLRESGAIEQDADVVMFVYREEYYESRRAPAENTDKHREWLNRMRKIEGRADVIIAKNRQGPTTTVPLSFNGELTKFSDCLE